MRDNGAGMVHPVQITCGGRETGHAEGQTMDHLVGRVEARALERSAPRGEAGAT